MVPGLQDAAAARVTFPPDTNAMISRFRGETTESTIIESKLVASDKLQLTYRQITKNGQPETGAVSEITISRRGDRYIFRVPMGIWQKCSG